MQKKISLKLTPQEAAGYNSVKILIAKNTGLTTSEITGYHILKKSLDARSKTVWIHLTVMAFINEPFRQRELHRFAFQDVSKPKKKVVIIGAGPAGLFAAIQLIE